MSVNWRLYCIAFYKKQKVTRSQSQRLNQLAHSVVQLATARFKKHQMTFEAKMQKDKIQMKYSEKEARRMKNYRNLCNSTWESVNNCSEQLFSLVTSSEYAEISSTKQEEHKHKHAKARRTKWCQLVYQGPIIFLNQCWTKKTNSLVLNENLIACNTHSLSCAVTQCCSCKEKIY